MALRRYDPHLERHEPWYDEDEATVHEAVASVIDMLDNDPTEQRRQRVYDRFEGRYHAQHSMSQGMETLAMQMNVCQAVVDAAAAQVAGNKTDVMCLTKQGDPSLQARAKKLNQFIEGCFADVDQYRIAQDLFLNCGKHGTSIEKIYEDPYTERIMARSIEPCNFLVPPQQTSQTELTQCFELERMPLDDAILRWPGKERELRDSKPIANRDIGRNSLYRHTRGVGDYVYLVHAYKKGQQGRAGPIPGRYVCVTSAGLIEDEPLGLDGLPYAICYWTRQSDNFWGLGIIHRIDAIQDELDHLCWKIQEHMRRATSFLFFQKGSVSEVKAFSNLIWQKVMGSGQAPTPINIPPIDAAYFSERDRLWSRAFDLSGVSPLAAQGLKPAGINSGKALRLYKDVANQRLKLPTDNFDSLNIQVAERMIALAKSISESGEDPYEVMAKGQGGVDFIKWREVDMDRDKFRLAMYPTSFLDQTPSGKLDDISDLIKTFPALEPFAIKAMDFPDLEAFTGIATARADEVLAAMEAITVHGRYVAPDPHTDLTLAVPYGLATYARGICDNLSDAKLQLVRDYLAACNALMTAASAGSEAAAPPPPGPAGPPPGLPPPPPGAMPPPEA